MSNNENYRMPPLQHGFKDPKWASPKAGFEKAKKQLESTEWEDVVDGVTAIVALVKKSPEVSLMKLKPLMILILPSLAKSSVKCQKFANLNCMSWLQQLTSYLGQFGSSPSTQVVHWDAIKTHQVATKLPPRPTKLPLKSTKLPLRSTNLPLRPTKLPLICH